MLLRLCQITFGESDTHRAAFSESPSNTVASKGQHQRQHHYWWLSALNPNSTATDNIQDDKDIPLLRLHVTSSIKIHATDNIKDDKDIISQSSYTWLPALNSKKFYFFLHAKDYVKGDTVTGGFQYWIQNILLLELHLKRKGQHHMRQRNILN